ncbi:MAG: FliM/FliN family flagellar motor switch protein [Pseudomonadota bacterium]
MSEEENPDTPESDGAAAPEGAETDAGAEDASVEGVGEEGGADDAGEGEALLSNDEIDALLEDVDADDVDGGPLGPAKVIDLADRGGSAFKMAGLDRVNAKFALQLRQGFYTFLRHRVDVSFDETTCPTFDEFLAGCVEPTSFTVMRMDPLPGQGVVAVPADLLYRVVDTLFGGSGADARAESMVEFTPTEIRVAQSLVDVTLTEYARAWSEVLNIHGVIQGHESNPRMVVITERSERVVVSRFTVTLEGAGKGQFAVVMPLAMLEPVRDELASDIQEDTEFNSSPDWSKDFRRELMLAEASVIARLATVDTTVRKLGNLQVGDILPVNEPDQVDLLVEGALFLQGRYGETRGNVAVRIETVADRVLELNPSEPARLSLEDDRAARVEHPADGA